MFRFLTAKWRRRRHEERRIRDSASLRRCGLRRCGRAGLDVGIFDIELLVLGHVLRTIGHELLMCCLQLPVFAFQLYVLNQHDLVDAIVVAFPYLALCFCMLAPRVGYCEAWETLPSGWLPTSGANKGTS